VSKTPWASVKAKLVSDCSLWAASSSASAAVNLSWAAETLAFAIPTFASYSALVSADADCAKRIGESASVIIASIKWVFLILSLLVGSAQQDYYTTTLCLC